MDLKAESWRRCSSCKSEIAYAQTYWVCNVSTCNRKRTGLAFCSVSCWDAHLPVMRHREAWARERTAPTRSQAQREGAEGSEQRGPGKAGGGSELGGVRGLEFYMPRTAVQADQGLLKRVLG